MKNIDLNEVDETIKRAMNDPEFLEQLKESDRKVEETIKKLAAASKIDPRDLDEPMTI